MHLLAPVVHQVAERDTGLGHAVQVEGLDELPRVFQSAADRLRSGVMDRAQPRLLVAVFLALGRSGTPPPKPRPAAIGLRLYGSAERCQRVGRDAGRRLDDGGAVT
jgi:hypothetical protein